MSIDREIISKDLDIDHISDRELASILDDMGRALYMNIYYLVGFYL